LRSTDLLRGWMRTRTLASKVFYGIPKNAVRVQIGIANAISRLITIVRLHFCLFLFHSRDAILQTPSLALFEKTPILRMFATHLPRVEPSAIRSQQHSPGF
ncbi:MAG: hypothetical protein ACUVWX_09040, partial [Kiritimatiellia bacterium]